MQLAWNDELGRFRSNLAYRGRADASESLHTSLMRLGGDAAALEWHLLRNFRKYATRTRSGGLDRNWLALAQPHDEVRDKLDQANVTERVLFPASTGWRGG